MCAVIATPVCAEDVIRNISSYDTLFKALIYTVAFIVEKLTLLLT